jgi:tetratricopeptide (TPR) repeat protein
MKIDDRGTPTAGSPLGLITGGTVDFALDEQGPMDDLNFIDLVSDVFRDDRAGKRSYRRTGMVQRMGDYLFQRFLVGGVLADVEWAIDLIEKDDSRVPSLISNLIRLGEYGRKKFKITSNPVDIDRSVEALRIALSVAPLDHPRRSLLLVATMSSLSCVDEYSEGQSQYEARLAEMYDEISLNSFDLPLQSEQLAAKAFAKSYKYMRSRNMDDLAQGISLFQQATKALPPDDEEWRSRCLYSLGHLLVIKFQRSKSVADIDAAIDVLHEMAQIGSVSTKKRANSLGALGRAFCTRGVVLSEMSDVEQGIERHEEQLKLLTPDDPDRAQCLYSLSEVISWRYIRSKKPSDIAKSIRLFKEAIATSPEENQRLKLQFQLGLRLCLRNRT